MLLKWIVCAVPTESREAFSRAQTIWRELEPAPGFLGQIGGWNVADPTQACILGLWRDEAAYRNFMENLHDPIFERGGQRGTYAGISVLACRFVFDVPGSLDCVTVALGRAKVLRVADCILKPNRNESFLKRQQTVWNPGMKQAPGMLAGVLGQVRDAENRFLVVTAWTDLSAHQAYVTERLPRLKDLARVETDVERLTGKIVALEDGWNVQTVEAEP